MAERAEDLGYDSLWVTERVDDLVVRANCHRTEAPAGSRGPLYAGSVDGVAQTWKPLLRWGAAEISFDVQYSPDVMTTADVVERIQRIWAAIH